MSEYLGAENKRLARILCRDPRLCRLVEMELSLCGVSITSEGFPSLVLVDLDEFDLPSVPEDTRLICWSRKPLQELLHGLENVIFLHRPFALDQLESCILRFTAGMSEEPSPFGGQFYPATTQPLVSRRVRKLGHGNREIKLSRLSWLDELNVSLDGQRISLSPREAALLSCLWKNRGVAVPKKMLWEALCAVTEDGMATTNTLEVYVCHLRRKLERPSVPRVIITVRGVGYRLNI